MPPNPVTNIRFDPHDLAILKEQAYQRRTSLSDHVRSICGIYIAETEEKAGAEQPKVRQQPVWWSNPTTRSHYELRNSDAQSAVKEAKTKLEYAQAALDEAIALKEKCLSEYVEFCEANNL